MKSSGWIEHEENVHIKFNTAEQILLVRTVYNDDGFFSGHFQVDFFKDPHTQYIGTISFRLSAHGPKSNVQLTVTSGCINKAITYQHTETLVWKFEVFVDRISIDYGSHKLVDVQFAEFSLLDQCPKTWKEASSTIKISGEIVTGYKITPKISGWS